MKPKPFDFEQAAKLENYVRKRYRNQLSNGALSFYLCAFQPLERAGFGLCKPITATYPNLAAAGLRNKSRIREVLDSLAGVLCEPVRRAATRADFNFCRLQSRRTFHHSEDYRIPL